MLAPTVTVIHIILFIFFKRPEPYFCKMKNDPGVAPGGGGDPFIAPYPDLAFFLPVVLAQSFLIQSWYSDDDNTLPLYDSVCHKTNRRSRKIRSPPPPPLGWVTFFRAWRNCDSVRHIMPFHHLQVNTLAPYLCKSHLIQARPQSGDGTKLGVGLIFHLIAPLLNGLLFCYFANGRYRTGKFSHLLWWF